MGKPASVISDTGSAYACRSIESTSTSGPAAAARARSRAAAAGTEGDRRGIARAAWGDGAMRGADCVRRTGRGDGVVSAELQLAGRVVGQKGEERARHGAPGGEVVAHDVGYGLKQRRERRRSACLARARWTEPCDSLPINDAVDAGNAAERREGAVTTDRHQVRADEALQHGSALIGRLETEVLAALPQRALRGLEAVRGGGHLRGARELRHICYGREEEKQARQQDGNGGQSHALVTVWARIKSNFAPLTRHNKTTRKKWPANFVPFKWNIRECAVWEANCAF